MYTGKIELMVGYHYNHDTECTTIVQETIDAADFWPRLKQIYLGKSWQGDDGPEIENWPDQPKTPGPDDSMYAGEFYQAVAYIDLNGNYFLATAAPARA